MQHGLPPLLLAVSRWSRRSHLRVGNELVGQPRGEEVGNVVGRDGHHFYDVGRDDLPLGADAAKQGQRLSPTQAARPGRADAGSDRRVQAIQVDGDVDTLTSLKAAAKPK